MAKNKAVKTLKAKPTLDSKAILENCRCQGETARRKALMADSLWLMANFPNNSFTKKYVATTVSIPKIADGNRTAKVFKPKMVIEGMAK